MAALAGAQNPDLVDLRRLTPSLLADLLAEEVGAWDRDLHWDFTPSADLVRRYVGMRALDGYALLRRGELIGYCYWVTEGRKALIGDIYVRQAWRSADTENELLSAVLEAIFSQPDFTASHTSRGFRPWIHRVEAQLMQLSTRAEALLPRGPVLAAFPRTFMMASLDHVQELRPVQMEPNLRFHHWNMRWLDESAALIAEVYRGHVDSQINDQYNSTEGARRFLQNIVQYPGCGAFLDSCSWVLLDEYGTAVGVVLSTRVSRRAGHIAQICVSRAYQGSGAGYELMRRALAALAAQGASEASLTVTVENDRARMLYERLGFTPLHDFDALVWNATGR